MGLRVALRSDFSGLLPDKGPTSKRPKTPAQSVRAFNPTCRQEPIRVSRELAPKHVGRKGNGYASSFILGSVLERRLAETSPPGNGGRSDRNNGHRLQLGRMDSRKHRQGDGAERRHPANLVELKKVSSWQQDTFIEKGGWATFPGMSSPERGVAQACANLLAAAAKQ